MSWYTVLFTPIFFDRKTYNHLGEVESDLDEADKLIDGYEHDLYSIGMITEPKKFCDEEEDPMSYIQSKIRAILEELAELYVERFKLETLIDDWSKCHNEEGYAIETPNEWSYGKRFLEGDFINHSKEEEELNNHYDHLREEGKLNTQYNSSNEDS